VITQITLQSLRRMTRIACPLSSNPHTMSCRAFHVLNVLSLCTLDLKLAYNWIDVCRREPDRTK